MTWLRALERVLLPDACARCRGPCDGAPFCTDCLPHAHAPDPAPVPPGLDAWYAAVPYADPWTEWIPRFKFPAPGLAGLDPAAQAVARWLIECAVDGVPARDWPDRVVAVPLHPRRRAERGFDQAAALARWASRHAGLPQAPGLLLRERSTRRQTGLGREERRRNVRGAFRARSRVPLRVWLVDDVATTGATLSACASALRAAGAVQVVGVCAALTPLGASDDDPLHPAPWQRSAPRSP